jgi:hypothetical protein
MNTTSRPVQPTDAEIEAVIADAMAAEAAMASSEAQPPSSAIVWWRAQTRARRKATELAGQPITIVHALSIAAGIGLMLSLVGYAIAVVKGSSGWLSNLAQSITGAVASMSPLSLTSPWVAFTLTGMLVTLIVASVAAYVIYSDE